MYLGTYKIDDYVPIPAVTHRFSSGAAYAPSAITYSIYEEGSTTGLDENVDMTPASPFDGVTGFYYARRQLTAAAGFEAGKAYVVLVKATVDSVAAQEAHVFQILAPVDARAVAGTAQTAGAELQEVTAARMGALTDLIDGGRLDLLIDALATAAELAKVPKSDGSASWNATALAAIQQEATDALNAYDPPTKAELDTAQGAVTLANGAHGGAAATLALGGAGGLTGAITGNLSGSVGSVTGAVGSVTGAVGSVTGNVGGNVAGSVASVTGAVGSVTGAVGSIGVGGIAANSFAAGAIDAAAIAANAIGAAEIAAGAIDNATLAADVEVVANVKKINDTALTGNGTTTPWGPA